MDEATKRAYHCGWMDPSEWTPWDPGVPDTIGDRGNRLTVRDLPCCPGWFVRQPAVEEAKLAGYAFEKGQLSTVFPNSESPVIDAATLVVCAWAEKEAAEMERLKERS